MASQLPSGKRLSVSVWVLGLVSMLMDISSEMIHSLLPLFMVGTLGASSLAVGILEGLAEATALGVKVFSGTLSDYLGKRKFIAALGYGMGAFSKPLFAIAGSMGMVTTARLLDRVGKGIRGAPRDALLAVPTVSEGMADAYVGRRDLLGGGGTLGGSGGGSLGGLGELNDRRYFALSTTRTFSIRAQATTQGGGRAIAEMVVRLTERGDRPYAVLAWREPAG